MGNHAHLCEYTKNGWANSQNAGYLRRHDAHSDVTVMVVLLALPRCQTITWSYVNVLVASIFKEINSSLSNVHHNFCSSRHWCAKYSVCGGKFDKHYGACRVKDGVFPLLRFPNKRKSLNVRKASPLDLIYRNAPCHHRQTFLIIWCQFRSRPRVITTLPHHRMSGNLANYMTTYILLLRS